MASPCEIEYTGFRPEAGWSPSVIRLTGPDAVSPEAFYRDYVRPRCPVVIAGGLPERPDGVTLDALLAWVGADTPVLTEPRGAHGHFGTGAARVAQPFGAVVRRLRAGDASFYVTTQYGASTAGEHGDAYDDAHEETDADATPPDQRSALEQALVKHLPTQPAHAGGLVLADLNLWLGAAARPGAWSSSGLHHDAQDNLYCVMLGTKRFRLYAPHLAPQLHLTGDVAAVKPNGLILYRPHVATLREDGAHVADVAQWRIGQLEAAISDADARGDAAAVAALEAELEVAMDVVAEHALDGSDLEDDAQDDDAEADDAEADDAEADDADDAKLDDADASTIDEYDPRGCFLTARTIAERDGRLAPAPASRDAKRRKVADDADVDADAEGLGGNDGADTSTERLPDHFSQIPITGLDALADDPEVGPPAIVTLTPGQILYLPASWFHEVASRGADAADIAGAADAADPKAPDTHAAGVDATNAPAALAEAADPDADARSGIHMAISYWFHPPTTTGSFEMPYGDAYWRSHRR
ncbi:hypothetical protein CXG81DRAFT_23096 [Caulochytrium protostelioides]|uniref:JmjC domain-containing protein n=1 Tax=Caulochytrium protostelioides TaxID=1555241 RepID=A0A4P9XGG2_9FUNG|nr:hypothetical protein CXG81DRAFT_23096 [Caulochytrium protostelioides]|eukprot:RKP04321.1 hypothetical protein CXG81DRAFT_23096 [Caulochytrium protostelioides]